MISSTVAGVVQEFLKTSERTVFWDDALKANVDPFQDMPNGFFATEWDLKVCTRDLLFPGRVFHCLVPLRLLATQLKILRQLVELQLSHSQEIKAIIDRAWGIVHNKHKKTETPVLPPPPGDPHSQERLQLVPLGQDRERKRYWVVDGKFRPVDTLF